MRGISSVKDALNYIKGHPNIPITLATRAEIGGVIVDGSYLSATPAAINLLNLRSESDLLQLYMSEIYDVPEYKRGLLMALARSRGYDITTAYVVHMRNGRAIKKETIPIKENGKLYWMTWLEPVKGNGTPDFKIEDLGIPRPVIREWCGLYTVAEMSTIVSQHQTTMNLLSRHLSETRHYVDLMQEQNLPGLNPNPTSEYSYLSEYRPNIIGVNPENQHKKGLTSGLEPNNIKDMKAETIFADNHLDSFHFLGQEVSVVFSPTSVNVFGYPVKIGTGPGSQHPEGTGVWVRQCRHCSHIWNSDFIWDAHCRNGMRVDNKRVCGKARWANDPPSREFQRKYRGVRFSEVDEQGNIIADSEKSQD